MVNINTVQWEYEDELPEMSDIDYALIYPESKVIDGVRMFPFIEHYQQDGTPIKLYIGA